MADWNEWNDREKAAQISTNLSGLARQAWADSFCESAVEVTYDAVVTTLTQVFKPEGQEEAYKVGFRCRVRKAEETFLEFGYSLWRLAIRAFPRLAHGAREDLVIDQFLLGLIDAEVWRHVSLAHPGRVDKAITLATEYETITVLYPHLHFGVLSWGFKSSRIHKLQKRAILAITSSTFNAHTEPSFKRLNILKISDIFENKV